MSHWAGMCVYLKGSRTEICSLEHWARLTSVPIFYEFSLSIMLEIFLQNHPQFRLGKLNTGTLSEIKTLIPTWMEFTSLINYHILLATRYMLSGISQLLLTQFGLNFKGKVKARSRQCQSKIKARSRQGQGNVTSWAAHHRS